MLSDKIIKRLDIAIDDYVLNELGENDKNIVIEKISNLDKDLLVKLAHFAVLDKDNILDEYRRCKTFQDFKNTQKRDINRKFLFDVYTLLIGNMSLEEVEQKYCSNKKKDLK